MSAVRAVNLKRLNPDQRAHYDSAGYVFPLSMMTAEELSHTRNRLQAFLASDDWPLTPPTRLKPHLYLKWVNDLVHHPALLDALEDILGPDILVWYSQFHFKPAGAPAIGWHHDSVYGQLDRDEVVTAWIALTDSTPENGCVQFYPGTHVENAARSRFAAAVAPTDRRPVDVVLRAGEASLHDLRITHGSLPNRTNEHRCGVVARYISAERVPRRRRAAATLVRGADRHGRFDLEPAPRFDRDPLVVPWHARYLRERRADLLRATLANPRDRLGIAWRMLKMPGNLRSILWRGPAP